MTHATGTLEQLRIAEPCGAAWNQMEGDERVRFCGECRKHVYQLSAMSRTEAEALVFENEGRICVRFYQRRDGTVLTDNCPVGVRRARKWLSMQLAAITAAFAGVVAIAPWAKAERLRENEVFQQIRHSPITQHEPLKSILDRVDPEPPTPMMGMIFIPPTATPTNGTNSSGQPGSS